MGILVEREIEIWFPYQISRPLPWGGGKQLREWPYFLKLSRGRVRIRPYGHGRQILKVSDGL
jgi:hypothetical protein